MNQVSAYSSAIWQWTTLLAKALWNHLPMVLLYLFIGFVVGLILSFLIKKLYKKKGIFIRHESASRGYRRWLKVSMVLSMLAVFCLSMITATYLASRKAVSIELSHSVDGVTEAIAQRYFGEEDGRARMEKAYDFVINSGTVVNHLNKSFAQSMANNLVANQQQSGLLSYFNGFLISDRIEDALVKVETEIVSTLLEIGLSTIKADGLVDYDSVEDGFDKWLHTDLSQELPDVQDVLYKLLWKYVGPAVFSVFIPFLLIALLIAIIPLIDRWIYKRRNAGFYVDEPAA